MIIDLSGKNALVGGSTQGIGKAAAIQLAESGASITLFARDESKLKKVINELPQKPGSNHDYLVADFQDNTDVKEKITDKIRQSKIYHIVINNTGGPAPGTAAEAETNDFIKGLYAHLISYQHILRAVLPGMKTERYGRIINIISTSVKVPIQGLGVSNTVRGAVASWAKTLATELAPFGITVNNILPGFTNTSRLKVLFEKRAKEAGISVEDYTKQAISLIPARRLAEPAETAYAITFLASHQAACITGINLPVDGGSTPCL